MPDTTPDDILARAQVPPSTAGPSARTRSSSTNAASISSRGCPSAARAGSRCCSSTASSAGSWVWERYLGYFAGRGWEGHALNLRNHHWCQTADPASSRSTRTSTTSWPRSSGSGRDVVVVGHGMGGLLALKAAERSPIAGLVLLAPELPGELRPPAPHELREIPELYGRSLHRLGDAAREAPARPSRPDDRRRPPHPAPDGPEAARGRARAAARCCAGVSVDRRDVADVPRLVIGGGLDRDVSRADDAGAPRRVARTPSTSRSGRTRTTAWSSARRATSRWPTRSGLPRGPPAVGRRGGRRRLSGIMPTGPATAATPCRIRLEAQDTALSRRRSPVRIRYAVPLQTTLRHPSRPFWGSMPPSVPLEALA